jgi:hypothetical protein
MHACKLDRSWRWTLDCSLPPKQLQPDLQLPPSTGPPKFLVRRTTQVSPTNLLYSPSLAPHSHKLANKWEKSNLLCHLVICTWCDSTSTQWISFRCNTSPESKSQICCQYFRPLHATKDYGYIDIIICCGGGWSE